MYCHILLEVYCMKNTLGVSEDSHFVGCTNESCIPQYACLEKKCPYAAFTSYEDAMCYANHRAVCEKTVAWNESVFVEKPELRELWKQIAIKKINEAQEEFLKIIDSFQVKED